MYSYVVRPTILSKDLVVYLSQFSIVCKNVCLSGTSYYTKYRPSSLIVIVFFCLYTIYSSVVRPTIISTDLAVYLSKFFIVCKNVWLSGTSYYTKYKPTSLVVLALYCLYKIYGLVVRPTTLSINLLV